MNTSVFSRESFQYQKNQHILTHYHDSIELIYIVDGSLNCLIQGKEYRVGKDQLCIINHNQLHRIYCSNDVDCVFHCLMIEPSLFTSDKNIYGKYIEPVLLDEEFSHIISSSKNITTNEVISLMNTIGEMEQSKAEAYELSIIALLHMIFQKLYLLYRHNTEKSAVFIDKDALLYRKIADFIYKNYHKKLLLDDIARAGNISRSKCCILFKKYAQNSPVDFLNLYRLEVSTSLLKTTDETIADIAFACGFGQQSYYNRLFLREYGMTPKEYRKSS